MYYLVWFSVKNCIALVSDVDNTGDCAYVGAEYMGNPCTRFCCKPETVLKNCLTANYHLCFSVSISIYSCKLNHDFIFWSPNPQKSPMDSRSKVIWFRVSHQAVSICPWSLCLDLDKRTHTLWVELRDLILFLRPWQDGYSWNPF